MSVVVDAWTSTYDEQPNKHVDVFDAAFPGTLPVSLHAGFRHWPVSKFESAIAEPKLFLRRPSP